MPELPEVETVARGLRSLLLEQRIVRVICHCPRLRYPLEEKLLNEVLAGKKLRNVIRRAKYMIWQAEGAVLVHLGMSGRFRHTASETPLARHEHIQFCLADGNDVRYQDPRRFGIVVAVPDGHWQRHSLIASLGPEPLPQLEAGYLAKMARGRQIAVKQFIMEQKIVVGVGNIYACEALFTARIRPHKPVSQIGAKRWQTLQKSIAQILHRAIKVGGTTLADGMFSDVSGNSGYFDIELQVYGRKGQPCKVCNSPIQNIPISGRSTFFCPRCQR